MRKLCTHCLKIFRGKPKHFLDSIYFGILEVVLGISVLYGGDFYGSSILAFVVGAALIVFGIISIVDHYRGSNICPSCSNETLIPLDNPEAIELIKEHDLSVPKEVEKKAENKLPWQSS